MMPERQKDGSYIETVSEFRAKQKVQRQEGEMTLVKKIKAMTDAGSEDVAQRLGYLMEEPSPTQHAAASSAQPEIVEADHGDDGGWRKPSDNDGWSSYPQDDDGGSWRWTSYPKDGGWNEGKDGGWNPDGHDWGTHGGWTHDDHDWSKNNWWKKNDNWGQDGGWKHRDNDDGNDRGYDCWPLLDYTSHDAEDGDDGQWKKKKMSEYDKKSWYAEGREENIAGTWTPITPGLCRRAEDGPTRVDAAKAPTFGDHEPSEQQRQRGERRGRHVDIAHTAKMMLAIGAVKWDELTKSEQVYVLWSKRMFQKVWEKPSKPAL